MESVAAALLLSECTKFAKETPVEKMCAEHKCAARRVPLQQIATIMQVVCIGCSLHQMAAAARNRCALVDNARSS